jgi:5-methylcytosine-specific restriction endonuclease McrA
MSGGWKNSDRAKRLPRGWPTIRARILDRDPVCTICGVRPSTQVDHHQAKTDDHGDAALRGVCGPCHDQKSSREGNAAQRTRRYRNSRRPPEQHPGLR